VKLRMMNFATWSEMVFAFEPGPNVLIVSVAAGALMGVFGGMLPAVRASRVSPVAAMRE
jgi:putative ABC transport system permease protein